MAYERNRLKLYKNFLQLLLQLAEQEDARSDKIFLSRRDGQHAEDFGAGPG